jgi:hypothetical protein
MKLWLGWGGGEGREVEGGAREERAMSYIFDLATTRGIIVSLKSKWKESNLHLLLTLNGGHAVQTTLQALGSLLPTLIETYFLTTFLSSLPSPSLTLISLANISI